MASYRGSVGVLETTSPALLNTLDGNSQPPLKRRKLDPKFSDITPLSSSYSSNSSPIIYIRNQNASTSSNIFSLELITLIPRSRISFDWFDTNPESLPIPPGSLFTANISILERDPASEHGPTILVARLLPGGGLYVIERVKRGIYALCCVASWIGESDLQVAAKGQRIYLSDTVSKLSAKDSSAGRKDWREYAGLDADAFDPHSVPQEEVKKLGVSLAFGPRTHPDLKVSQCETMSGSNRSQTAQQQQQHALVNITCPATSSGDSLQQHPDMPETAQTVEGILNGLREQYLETLYASKTSVAYFAKGPLSRCRAAFQSPNQNNLLTASELLGFYRGVILPLKKMDAKYKETLPSMVRDSSLFVSDEDENTRKRKLKSTGTKTKRKKLRKNGLYPDEEHHICQWWKSRHAHDTTISLELKVEDEIKKYIGDLRLRETQLQILLILETMILEACQPRSSAELVPKSAQSEGNSKKTRRKKKEQDLNFLLELLLDRLCIWHTVRPEDALIVDVMKEIGKSSLSGKQVDSDVLRDFCTEVIIPFYAARLPEQCKAIKRKLGGPNFTSPGRPTAPSKLRPIPNKVTKPGQQPAVQKVRRTLQRVLTDEKAVKSRHPSLSRSSTAPSTTHCTRDSVEPVLPSVNTNVRGGIQVAKRANHREVDLNAAAKQHEAKLKKVQTLMEQKRELDAAINALRKPNRELISKEIADSADKRLSSNLSRKPKNPVRNPFGQGVQVMATPRGLRKKDVSVELPLPLHGLSRQSVDRNMDTSPNLGSDISAVPGSAIRPTRSSKPSVILGSDLDRGTVQSVHETPSRGLSKLSSCRPLSSMEASSPQQDPSCSRVLFRKPELPTSRARSNVSAAKGYCILEYDEGGNSSNVHDKTSTSTTTLQHTSILAVSDTPPRSSPIIVAIPPPGCRSAELTVSTPPSMTEATRRKEKRGMDLLQSRGEEASPPERTIYEELGWDNDDNEYNDYA